MEISLEHLCMWALRVKKISEDICLLLYSLTMNTDCLCTVCF